MDWKARPGANALRYGGAPAEISSESPRWRGAIASTRGRVRSPEPASIRLIFPEPFTFPFGLVQRGILVQTERLLFFR